MKWKRVREACYWPRRFSIKEVGDGLEQYARRLTSVDGDVMIVTEVLSWTKSRCDSLPSRRVVADDVSVMLETTTSSQSMSMSELVPSTSPLWASVPPPVTRIRCRPSMRR